MTAVTKSVKEALSRFSGQRHNSSSVPHEFISGRTNPRRQSPATHEFIHGIEDRHHHPLVAHEFIRGNQKTNVKICSFPRFQSWKTRKITISYTPIPAILMNECTEYDYIMFTNEFPDGSGRAVDCGFPRFIRMPTNEFVAYGYVSMSFSLPTNEFVGWDYSSSLIMPTNEFVGYAPLAVYKFLVSEN